MECSGDRLPVGGGARADARGRPAGRRGADGAGGARRARRDDRRISTRWRRSGSREAGATPAFKGYHGYPATICASINDEVIHGIPSGRRVLSEGDIISIDVGASLDGYFGDSAITLPVGQVSEEAATLLRVTEESLYKAIERVRPGGRISDIGHAVQQHVEALRVLGGARVRRPRHRAADARGAAGAELRRAGARAAAGRGHGARDRADGERRQAGGEGAGGRLDRGDARQQPVGAFRAHGGGDGGRAMDSDGARSAGRRRGGRPAIGRPSSCRARSTGCGSTRGRR